MKHHVVAVQVRLPDGTTVEDAAHIVHEALRESGLEASVAGGARTESNFGEHLAAAAREGWLP